MGKIDDNKRLTYITDLRILVTLMVVFYHSFEIFVDDNCGLNFPRLSIYQGLDIFIGLVQMPMFVFLSGYLFGLQYRKGRYIDFAHLIKKKTQRILAPLLVFGMAYYLLIPSVILEHVVWFNSIGHLWFLEMLFECFILQWCVRKVKATKQLILAVAMSVVSTKVPLLFGVNTLCIYFVYFNLAFLFAVKNRAFDSLWGGKLMYLVLVLSLASVYVINGILIGEDATFIHFSFRIYKMVVSLFLCIFLMRLFSSFTHQQFSLLNSLDQTSFGIYLIHPFIMFALLYHVDWVYETCQISPYKYQACMFFFLVLASYLVARLLKKMWFFNKIL